VIQIDEPPDQPACSTCGALIWLWSPRREAWVCFVTGPDRTVIRLHGCRHAQDPATWRDIPRGDPPNEMYRQAYEAIGHKTEKINEEEQG
jgi:hypothetical protein